MNRTHRIHQNTPEDHPDLVDETVLQKSAEKPVGRAKHHPGLSQSVRCPRHLYGLDWQEGGFKALLAPQKRPRQRVSVLSSVAACVR